MTQSAPEPTTLLDRFRSFDAQRTAVAVRRPMELEPVVGAVVEPGERLGVPMAATRAVYACTPLLGEQKVHKELRMAQEVAR
jgi:hypothetical protein